MTTTAREQNDHPYADAAGAYWQAGWRGILPVPTGAKWPPPAGWTGADADWPSYPDIQAWIDARPASNIALRMPQGLIGLDVDAYDGKAGQATIEHAEQLHGPLPSTWRTSSRTDPISGIRIYRVPPNLSWPGELGPGVEIIQTRHRYAVVWPSTHPSGATYRWTDPDGIIAATAIPAADSIPFLPDPWVQALTGGRAEQHHPRAGLTDGRIWDWLADHGGGKPCSAVSAYLDAAIVGLGKADGSRHDAALHATRRLAQLAADGHTGVTAALKELQRIWRTAVQADPTRPDDPAEWARMVTGAVDQAATSPQCDVDPCANPFHGIIAPTTPSLPPAADRPAPAATVDGQFVERERTTWWPKDLAAILDGTRTDPPPSHLLREDGVALLYTGKVNGIIGESESGKSWIGLHAVTQALDAGQNVTVLDFEDSDAGVVGRLLDLGVEPAVIAAQFAYIQPEDGLSAIAAGDLHEHLQANNPGLIVLDGFNAAMTLLGLDLMSNTDATRFSTEVLKPLAATGACVVYVDHVPKSKDNESKGGIGAQAKRAMTSGVILKAEVILPFGRGTNGKIRLLVDKDRPGHIRGGLDGGRTAGTVNVTSTADSTQLTIAAPERHTADQPFRPTHLMAKISRYLETTDGVTQRAIERDITGNASAVREAVQRLVEDGYVKREPGPRNSTIHSSVKPYSELSDLVEPPNPTSASSVRPTASKTQCETPPPVRPVTASSPRRGDAGRTQGSADENESTATASKDALNSSANNILAVIRATKERGGEPAWVGDQLVDTTNGEILLTRQPTR